MELINLLAIKPYQPRAHFKVDALKPYFKVDTLLTAENLASVLAQLKSYPSVHALDLSNTKLTNEMLIEIIQACPDLKDLKLEGCKKLAKWTKDPSSAIILPLAALTLKYFG